LRALSGVAALAIVIGLVVGWLLRSTPRWDAASGWKRWLNDLRDGLSMHRWTNLLVAALLVAPLPWLWETVLISVASRAFGFSLTASESFAVLSAFNLATVIPSPGNAGSLESGGTLALLRFNVQQSTALAFMLLYHLTQVLPSVGAGAWVLISERRTLARALLRSPKTRSA
ncbi:MAG TPA: lysylphosphatidylglycerol synthase domain-containing protein, partial [Myxococcaceae bacterium]|nr:lysylphosphatidylglycerol synthase domain-containing protein [Myxococcaceae bacterium]